MEILNAIERSIFNIIIYFRSPTNTEEGLLFTSLGSDYYLLKIVVPHHCDDNGKYYVLIEEWGEESHKYMTIEEINNIVSQLGYNYKL